MYMKVSLGMAILMVMVKKTKADGTVVHDGQWKGDRTGDWPVK